MGPLLWKVLLNDIKQYISTDKLRKHLLKITHFNKSCLMKMKIVLLQVNNSQFIAHVGAEPNMYLSITKTKSSSANASMVVR